MRVPPGGRAVLATSLIAGLAVVPLAATPAAAVPGAASTVFVNEFHYDNTGTDAGEFIEVAGPAGTDLTGWSLVLYNGANGQQYDSDPLPSPIPNQLGRYGTVVVSYPENGLQNGSPDGIALVAPGPVVVQFLSYEGAFVAANGPAVGLTSTDIGVSQSGSEPVGSSLQLTGTGTAYGDFVWTETEGSNTAGAPNAGQVLGDGSPPPPLISEIRIDQTGTDNDEYVELTGAPSSSVDGLTYVVIGDGAPAAGSGVVETVVGLAGQTIGASGFFVVAETTFTLGTADLVVGATGLNFENDDNVTHLLVRGFNGANGQDLDTDDDGVLDVQPWAEVLDRIALIEEQNPPAGTEYHYGPPTVGPDGAFVPGHAFRCTDEDEWRVGAFDPAAGDDTPGATNACDEPPPPAEVCGDEATLIHQIQGTGAIFDPAFGEQQSVEGVVTAVMLDLDGFYVQEEAADADADARTSEGIFVFTGSGTPTVEAGQVARVRGTVAEFTGSGSSQTQLTSPSVQVCGLADPPIEPAEVAFPLAAPGDLERYEGMLVELVDELVISEYFNYERFGEVVLAKPLDGLDRLHTPTAVVEPGPAAQALAAEYALRRITLDDANSAQNPDSIPHPGNGEPFSLDNRFRGGDTVTGVQGVVDHTFGVYRVQPTVRGEYEVTNTRPEQPPAVGGDLKVASFNVLNYFPTIDDGVNDICGPDEDQECRGADDANELARQRAKILDALARLDADIVGLMEMENTTGVEPAADLVAGLNDRLGAGTYDFVDTGVIGTDAIRLGFLYKPGTVRPAGDFEILDSSVDPRFIDTLNRPMLTQTFDEVATGARLTVSVNHLKSKGSDCDAVGDPDEEEGQGNCNKTREAAALAIADFLAGDPTGSGDPDHLVIGDLNSYDHEDPIDALQAAGYTDQIKRFGGEFAYGFVFDGQVGYLDHALANASLDSQVTGAAEWHVNADEPDIIDYDTTFKPDAVDAIYAPDAFRSSDHDPVLVGLSLTPVTPPACYADGAQSVRSYAPGVRANGTAIPPAFRNPQLALGLSDPSDEPYYASLGFGGEIVLSFDRPVQNNNGTVADLRVVDAADGAKGRGDAARVLASWDGTTWVDLGRVTGTGEVDLGALPAARHVKVVDATQRSGLPAAADGYDLDAVEVLTGCVA